MLHSEEQNINFTNILPLNIRIKNLNFFKKLKEKKIIIKSIS